MFHDISEPSTACLKALHYFTLPVLWSLYHPSTMRFSPLTISIISLFLLLASCRPSPSGHVILESRQIPQEWVKSEKLDPRAVVSIRVALKESSLDMAPDYFMSM